MASDDGVLDLLVIGGGTAGIVGARTAAGLGARTVLVERSRTGGDCLWTGRVPSKTILSAARASAVERELTGSGTDFSAVRARIAAAIAAIQPDDSPESLRDAGVTVLSATARFTAPGEADVDGRTVRFRQALIATGSAPTVPGIPGLDDARTVTSETVRDLEELPRRLVVVGGGPIDCELGQAFARLGARVVLVARSGILPQEDRDAAALVRENLVSDGVRSSRTPEPTGSTPTRTAAAPCAPPTGRRSPPTSCSWRQGGPLARQVWDWTPSGCGPTTPATSWWTRGCAPRGPRSGRPGTSPRTPSSPISPGCTAAPRPRTRCWGCGAP
ncbi:FAD-dependent oxidoreductase [Kocuria sp. CPCC 205290]